MYRRPVKQGRPENHDELTSSFRTRIHKVFDLLRCYEALIGCWRRFGAGQLVGPACKGQGVHKVDIVTELTLCHCLSLSLSLSMHARTTFCL